MSMLDTLGGLSGGLGGVGMGEPANTTASSAAASVVSNPAIALGGVGGSGIDIGPFAPQFPGAYTTPLDSINSPNVFSIPGAKYFTLAIVGAIVFALGLLFLKKV